MALAAFFDRTAVAASQILLGYDDLEFRRIVSGTSIGLAIGADAVTGEGAHAADMTVRLLARLYPIIVLHVGIGAERRADELDAIARAINPNVEMRRDGSTTKTIVLGRGASAPTEAEYVVYVGSNGWDARLSATVPLAFGSSGNPFGAGAAAAIACADVFATVFGIASPIEGALTLSTLEGTINPTMRPLRPAGAVFADAVLVGLGALGNPVVWALARSGAQGELHLIDDESNDLGNLQRYVLAQHRDIDAPKTDVMLRHLGGALRGIPHSRDYASFISSHGYRWDQAIVAVDSAAGRRAVQASLPRRIVNGWTHPDHLGVSEHGSFGNASACLACLYLPRTAVPSSHEVIATALRIPDRLIEVRDLLFNGAPVPDEMVTTIVVRFGIPDADTARFRGRPIRTLYTDGLCGGALVPLAAVADAARRDMHVPVAHQSALAGILLAAAAIRQNLSGATGSVQTLINLRKPLPPYLNTPLLADNATRCICRDPVYVAVYERKYTAAAQPLTTLFNAGLHGNVNN
jgi:hypothetical protein